MALFHDRAAAGKALAAKLTKYKEREDVVVLGLPRGGVPVAAEVARELQAPLDIFVVRKLGAPGQQELAFGAIASGGVRVLNDDVVRKFDVPDEWIDGQTEKEMKELERRENQYAGNRERPTLLGKTIIIVDDGLATGATMHAAVSALLEHEPKAVVVAAPVGAPDTCKSFKQVADDVVCAEVPEAFLSVGSWYEEFEQTTDEEVRELLGEAAVPAHK